MALDTLYTAETPEGIALSLRPAGIVPRLLAFALDFLLRIVVFIVVALAGLAFGGMGEALMLVSYFLLEWFYPVFFELTLAGATPGKRIMGLEVRMDSGLPITPSASITRNLLRAADFLPFLYGFAALSMLLRRDFKRLGDLAAGTLVVYSRTVGLHRPAPEVEPRAPAHPLKAHQQAAILAWAGRAQTLTPERLDELARLAKSAAPADPGAPPDQTQSQRLLAVAQWLMGRRPGGSA